MLLTPKRSLRMYRQSDLAGHCHHLYSTNRLNGHSVLSLSLGGRHKLLAQLQTAHGFKIDIIVKLYDLY